MVSSPPGEGPSTGRKPHPVPPSCALGPSAGLWALRRWADCVPSQCESQGGSTFTAARWSGSPPRAPAQSSTRCGASGFGIQDFHPLTDDLTPHGAPGLCLEILVLRDFPVARGRDTVLSLQGARVPSLV